ncbi:kinase-like domain-containing protein [Suillus subaureus]|uniref:non-specific serine/threonine protein kinase n=1 Tax=Suillus subaureus TaxID=48587 RepID=A0A9P7EMP3_9AGAM|nr:kinase-like domain-containing protein [Suillus subaureus]KAG1826199.1 kinase-like domain-containing protein [Suillus subaureus]
MAPHQPCVKYQYVLTSSTPKIVPVPDQEPKDEESPADYNTGGYMVIKIDDTFKEGRYIVARKLGWGHFSTVWLIKDTHENRYSALKVVKSATRYAETARDEIKLLSQVAAANPHHPGRQHVVSFLDSFQHHSPQDTHVCIVFEPLGETLLALIQRNKKKGVPKPLVKVIAKQVLLGLQYLHDECDLVHTDIKPENILISIPDVEARIHTELSISPKPTSYHVGVPQPTKSRSGLTIPYRHVPTHERCVQIFDSQPLSSPSSRSGSISANASSHSFQKQFSGTTPISGAPVSQLLRKSARVDPTTILHDPPSSSSSTSSTISSTLSTPAASNSAVSTPPTSVESADIPILTKMASLTLMNASLDAKECVIASEQHVSTSPLIQSHASSEIHHITPGPSLLTQTAPHQSSAPSLDRTPLSPSSGVPVLGPLSTPLSAPLSAPLSIKIADLGNATPSKQHFTEDIQTRQYRAPEAILGRRDWGTRADVWSVACVVFELLTAEYLFDPHGQGEMFTKDDDHMAQIIELLGDFPLDAKIGGRYSREIFDHAGSLRYIKTLRPWPLNRVMTEKYLFSTSEADNLCSFLEPMLAVDQRERKEVRDMIDHHWLNVKDDEWVGVDSW